MNNIVAIAGASGYIGKRLVAELVHKGDVEIKILSRTGQLEFDDGVYGSNVEVIKGDLLEPRSLKQFFAMASTVVNLVYLWDAGEAENVNAAHNIINACRAANVERLIHCSTADVVGRTSSNLISEKTHCQPITKYAKTKLKVEKVILSAAYDCFETIILRPTAVVGPESKNLQKLADDLTTGSRLNNYLKSCLFGPRRMNLVCIDNVVASILFLIYQAEKLNGEVFIVSDDDSSTNNFVDIESFLMRELNIPDYVLPRLTLPLSLLALLLRCLGKNNVNPHCIYTQEKIVAMGFEKVTSFEAGLAEYATWYRTLYLEGQKRISG